MQATLQPRQQPDVENQLARAPAPPKTTPSISLVSLAPLRSRISLLTARFKGTQVAAPDRTSTQPSGAASAPATNVAGNTPNTTGGLSQASKQVPAPSTPHPPAANQIQSSSSTTPDASLLATQTQSTSQTSTESVAQRTKVQGFWVSNQMPNPELVKLWEDRIRRRLDMELFEHIRTGGWVLEFGLLGRTQSELSPHIIVTCVEKETKKEVERFYRSRHWLKEAMKAHQIRLITLHATTRLAARVLHSPSTPGVLMSRGSTTYCGSLLQWPQGPATPGYSWGGVLGGLILVKGSVYALSAGHAFTEQGAANQNSLSTPRTVSPHSKESDSDSSPGIFDGSEDLLSLSSNSSLAPHETEGEPPSYLETLTPRIFPPTNAIELDRAQCRPAPRLMSKMLPKPYLDWAIIDLGAGRPQFPNRDLDGNLITETIDIPQEARTVSILQEGCRGFHATLHPITATLGLSGYSPTIAYRISMKSKLAAGFSGAWVLLDGKVCGHIVAAREDVPWCYMQPIKMILEEIGEHLETHDVSLLPADYPHRTPEVQSKRDTIEAAAPSVSTPPTRPLPALAARSRDSLSSHVRSENSSVTADSAYIRALSSRPRPTLAPISRRAQSRISDGIERDTPGIEASQRLAFKKDHARPSKAAPSSDPEWEGRPIGFPYYFELFVVRHEFRRKRYRREHEEDQEYSARQRLSDKLRRKWKYSIPGTFEHELAARIYGDADTRVKTVLQRTYNIYRWYLVVVFAVFYLTFCMPFHWWIANKHRDILETPQEKIARMKRVDLMLRYQRGDNEYEQELRELPVPRDYEVRRDSADEFHPWDPTEDGDGGYRGWGRTGRDNEDEERRK